jgi:hypothetical protein
LTEHETNQACLHKILACNQAHAQVIAIRNATLIEVWRDEVRLLGSNHFEKLEIHDKDFVRKARISPTELVTKLPDNWRDLAKWTSTEKYRL